MFLNSLNSKQKKLFIDLAIKAAESNGIVPIEQKNMLKSFAIEMNIEPQYSSNMNIEDIISELKAISSEKELKIILFEILGIIISDSVFDEDEKKFVNHWVEMCGLDKKYVEQMVGLLQRYSDIYNDIVKLVLMK